MNSYLTDEELNSFIEELEKEELYAPVHLKAEIFDRLNAQKTAASRQSAGKREKPISFFVYTLKMAAGMAAAMVLVFTLPVPDGSAVSRAEAIERDYEKEVQQLKETKQREGKLSLDERMIRYREEKRKNGKESPEDMIDKINDFLNGGNENES